MPRKSKSKSLTPAPERPLTVWGDENPDEYYQLAGESTRELMVQQGYVVPGWLVKNYKEELEAAVLRSTPTPATSGSGTPLSYQSVEVDFDMTPPATPCPFHIPTVGEQLDKLLKKALGAGKSTQMEEAIVAVLFFIKCLRKDKPCWDGITIDDLPLGDYIATIIGKASPPPPPPPAPASDTPKPAKKRARISESTPPLPAAKVSAPAPKKAVAAPPPPALPTRPSPKDAPPVSVSKPKAMRRKRGKHTIHGTSRRGILLSPPAGASITAALFTPAVINSLNTSLHQDLKAEGLVITIAHAAEQGRIFLDTSRVPTSAETAFVLKHVRRLLPTPAGQPNMASISPTSTSYLKIVDIPVSRTRSNDWVKIERERLNIALRTSLVGLELAKLIKHAPRIMRTSPHSDSGIAWIDIEDTVTGRNASHFKGKFVSIGGVNCRIAGASPHSGSTMCTRCMRWGHHSSACRAKGTRCPLCGGPHSEANHAVMVGDKDVAHRHCVNCSLAKKSKADHSSLDRKKCPFWKHRFDRDWLQRQFKRD